MPYREPINSVSEKEKEAVLALTKYFNDFWVIVDIGSNKGNFSDILLQEREPSQDWEKIKLYMIEPNKLLLDYCRIKYEHTDKIVFINEALGANFEYKDFYYFEDNHSGISNFLGNWQELNPKISRIPTKRLDSFSFDKEIDIVKIDVEGAEKSVIEGSENLLKDKKIKFLQVECSPHNKDVKFQDIVQYLGQFGYQCWDYKDGEFIKILHFPEDTIENYYFTYMNIGKGSRDHLKMNYTQLWNGEFIKNTQFLKKKVEFALEIGVFEGLTSNYICDELLTEGGRMIAVDPLWEMYTPKYVEHEANEWFKGQYERFINNTREQPIELIQKTSEEAYADLDNYLFDFVFIDGDHDPEPTYKDAVFSFNHLKVGGHILMDDYEWGECGKGIDKFLEEFKDYIEIVSKNYQVMVRKTKNLPTLQEVFDDSTIYRGFCNLDERPERLERITKELTDVGLTMQRIRSYPWRELWDSKDPKYKIMGDFMVNKRKTPGALGCWFSQIEILKRALAEGKHAWVNEDDVIFAHDIRDRLQIIYKFLYNQKDWDVFWMGGTYHKNECVWHQLDSNGIHVHPEIKGYCNCTLNRDWEPTDNPQIVRTFAAFSTHSYIVNKDKIKEHLELMEKEMHKMMGVDFFYITHQPYMKTYAFNPGCVRQYTSQSNIGHGISNQDGFQNLGQHVFSRYMTKYKWE